MIHTSRPMVVMSLTVSTFLLGWTLDAECGPSDDETKGKERASQGIEYIKQENYPAALDAFQEAHRLYPKPALLYNIAMCQKALYRYVEAIATFKRFLEEGGGMIKPDMRRDAEAAIAQLKPLVGRLRIADAPVGIKVLIDDREVERTQFDEPLLLDPGVHTVRVIKEGYVPLRTTVQVASNAEVTISAELEPTVTESQTAVPPATVARPAPPTDAPREAEPESLPSTASRRVGLKTAGWLAAAVGAGTLIGGVVTGVMALGLNAELKEECGDGLCTEENRGGDLDRRDTLAVTTNVMLTVGGTLAVAGGALLFFSYKGERDRSPVAVSPSVGPGFAGATLTGRF